MDFSERRFFGHSHRKLPDIWAKHKKSRSAAQLPEDPEFRRVREILKVGLPWPYRVVKMPIAGRASSSLTRLKKKIRPSSAAANLQTYPGYSSGLYDNAVRPATASTVSYLSKRPATQASGPRRPWQQRPTTEARGEKDIIKQPRRLTLGAVDGIAEAEAIIRPGLPQGTAAHQLKSKVSHGIYLCVVTILLSLHTVISYDFRRILTG